MPPASNHENCAPVNAARLTSREVLRAFFNRRGLSDSKPNELQRPIYAFHPSRSEFKAADAVLKREIGAWATDDQAGAAQLEAIFDPNLCAIFVLWCAVSLSCEYNGGKWKWAIIESRLGLAPKVQTLAQWPRIRGQIVRKGARAWNLRGDVQAEGKKFIGFLMSQCGIPVQAMVMKSGWASASKLVPILNDLRRGRRREDEIARYVREHVLCPKSLSEEIFVDVMTKAALSLGNLPRSLTPRSPQDELDKAYEAVSDAFPAIEFSRESFDLLVETQELEAMESEEGFSGDASRLFAARRNIAWTPESCDAPILSLTVFLTQRAVSVAKQYFAELFPAVDEDPALLSRTGSIYVGGTLVAVAEPLGEKVKLVYQTHPSIYGAEALKPARAELRNRLGTASSAKPLGRQGGLDPLIPMLFEPASGEHGEWRFCGPGTLRSTAGEALLLCSTSAEILPAPKAEDILSAHFAQAGGETLQLVRLTSSAEVRMKASTEGNAATEHCEDSRTALWRITLRGQAVEPAEVEFGSCPQLETAEGLPVFRGFPAVHLNGVLCSTVRSQLNRGCVRWSPCLLGGRIGRAFESDDSARTGKGRRAAPRLREPQRACVCRAEVFRAGELVGMLSAVILPRESREIIDERSGNITLSGWGSMQVQCLSAASRTDADERSDIKVEETADGIRLHCRKPASIEEFEFVEPFFAVFSPGIGSRPFTLRFDYPRSCALFRLAGKPLRRKAGCKDPEVAFRQAKALSAYIVGDPEKRYWLKLSTFRKRDGSEGLRVAFERAVRIPLDRRTHAVMLGFDDFADELESLLRVSCRVRLEVFADSLPLCKAYVSDEAELWLELKTEELVIARRSVRLARQTEASGPLAVASDAQPECEGDITAAPYTDGADDDEKEIPCIVAAAPLFPLPPESADSDDAEKAESGCRKILRFESRTGDRIALSELEAHGLDRRVPWAAWLEEQPAVDAGDGTEERDQAEVSPDRQIKAFAGTDRPVVIPAREELLATEKVKRGGTVRSAFLLAPHLWDSGKMTAYDYDAAEYFVRSALLQPADGRYWNDVADQLELLGRRGFAKLPYWSGIRKNVPLAFAFAAGIDLLAPPSSDAGESSLLRMVGLSRGWRWDFLSVEALERALALLAVFISGAEPAESADDGAGAATAEQVKPKVLGKLAELLDLDVCRRYPILGQKILAAMGRRWSSVIAAGQADSLIGDLFERAIHSPFSCVFNDKSADALNLEINGLKKEARFRNPLIKALNENHSVADAADRLLAIIREIAARFDSRGSRNFFQSATQDLDVAAGDDRRVIELERAMLAASYAWARAYRLAFPQLTAGTSATDAADEGCVLMLSALAEIEPFFAAERLFDVCEEWTVWCMAFAETAARSAPPPKADFSEVPER